MNLSFRLLARVVTNEDRFKEVSSLILANTVSWLLEKISTACVQSIALVQFLQSSWQWFCQQVLL